MLLSCEFCKFLVFLRHCTFFSNNHNNVLSVLCYFPLITSGRLTGLFPLQLILIYGKHNTLIKYMDRKCLLRNRIFICKSTIQLLLGFSGIIKEFSFLSNYGRVFSLEQFWSMWEGDLETPFKVAHFQNKKHLHKSHFLKYFIKVSTWDAFRFWQNYLNLKSRYWYNLYILFIFFSHHIFMYFIHCFIYVNSYKIYFVCYHQDGSISSLNRKDLKLVNQFIYYGSNISSIKSRINL